MHCSSNFSAAYRPPPEPRQPERLPQDFRVATLLVRDYHPNLTDGQIEPIRSRVLEHIYFLRSAFPDFADLKGKRVVDIACGSRNYQDDTSGKYEPWMCRLLVTLGAHPLGVDLAPQSNEHFAWKQADLLVPGSLGFLEKESFDAYYICAFPTKVAATAMLLSGSSWPSVRTDILHHAEQALKPGGKAIRTFTNKTEEYMEEMRQQLLPQQEVKLPPHLLKQYEDCFFD